MLFVQASNILNLIKDYNFILDGTDNFPLKFLINDACVIGRKPFSHAGILFLDEITANHDADTKASGIHALKTSYKGRTVISISHRLSQSLDQTRIIEIQ